MNNHTEILNNLIKIYGLKSYLEVGSQHKVNFNAIELPEHLKFCVDPEPDFKADFIGTSDEYFANITSGNIFNIKRKEFDCIFLDGLHHELQVRKDFESALNILSQNGYIVIHDTVPPREEITIVPRQTKEWCGSVYRFACTLCKYDFIDFKTFPVDYGVTICWRVRNKNYNKQMEEITWKYFEEHKAELLRFDNELPKLYSDLPKA